MAWKYPKRPIKGTYVTDIDAINQNFLTVSEESSGHLNEHNFRGPGLRPGGLPDFINSGSELIITREDAAVAEDIGFRLHRTVKEDAAEPWTYSASKPSGWIRFRDSDFYVTKPVTGLSMRRTFVGGTVWICASFNLHNHPDFKGDPASDGSALVGEKGFGYNLAIEVDGTIIPESLLGTGDITQECFGNEDFENPGGGHTGNVKAKARGGGGVNGARNAIVLDAVVYLPPGPHVIRVAIQSIRNSAKGFGPGYECKTYVSTAELFALEMLR